MPERTASKVILLQPLAPPKPRVGEPCNGCGVCCAAEPCPLGALLSRRWSGSCRALGFDAKAGRYHCGALAQPARWLPWLPERWARHLVRRWISCGSGCDSSLVTEGPATGV